MDRVLAGGVLRRPVPRPLARARPGGPGGGVGRAHRASLPVCARPGADLTTADESGAWWAASCSPGIRLLSRADAEHRPSEPPTSGQDLIPPQTHGEHDDDRDRARPQASAQHRGDHRPRRVNDLEAILSFVGKQDDRRPALGRATTARRVHLGLREGRRPKLDKLYEKAKNAQWNGAPTCPGRPRSTRRPWSWPTSRPTPSRCAGASTDSRGHRAREVGREGVGAASAWRTRTGRSASSCTASRARLLCTAKIVETVPWIDAKYYAATQVVDEARHVEVFSRYLDEKLSGHYPINGHLGLLLDDIIADSRWDMTYLGHADHGGGPRPRRLRLHAPDHPRAAAQEAAALRDGRRGPPRRLRRAQPPGALPASCARPRCASARSSPSRRPCACATGCCMPGGLGPHGRAPEGHRADQRSPPGPERRTTSRSCCSPRSCRTARSSGCSTPPTAGCATKFTEMGVIAFEHFEDTTEEADALRRRLPGVERAGRLSRHRRPRPVVQGGRQARWYPEPMDGSDRRTLRRR